MRLRRLPAALLFVFTLVPASAHALDAEEAACHDTIAEALTRYTGIASKTVVRCHKRRSSGQLDLNVDCNNVAQADVTSKLGSARARALSDVLDACDGDSAALLDLYPACPAPVAAVDDGGATTGIDDFTEVTLCLVALANYDVGALGGQAQGDPEKRMLDPLVKCQGALGKGTARIIRTYMRERRRCQYATDVLGGDGSYACGSVDPRGRISDSIGRYADKTTGECDYGPDVLSQIEACASDTAALVACSAAHATDHGSSLIRHAYDLTAPAVPTTTTTTLPGGTTTTTLPGSGCGSTFPTCDGACPLGFACTTNGGDCSCEATGTGPCAPATIYRNILSRYTTEIDSVTSLNAGWSGLAFDLDVPDRSADVVDVVCDENCENCDVSLHREPGGIIPSCNCTSNPELGCGVINGSDPDNCGSIDPTCRCFFGAPLPIAASGNPACVPMRIRNENGGTMDLRTGVWRDTMSVAAVVYLGLDAAKPCPTCDGDPVHNDGLRQGTCSGGLGGGACDGNGTHPTYGTTSNDCLPAAAANISGTGLLIDLNLSTSEVTLPATQPCDTPSGELCHCRTCTGNSNLSCSNTAQCAAIGAGTCTASGGAGVRLNQCDNFECSPNGECTTGPVDSYCDGAVFPDGSGYIPCTSDSDCSGNGACTIFALRRCFPDPVVFTGTPDPVGPTSVSAFCVAPTSNPAINIASGLPGPGALLLTYENDVRCKSDPTIPYDFPSGAACAEVATTTTTLLPIPECDGAEAPVCGGLCPVGSVCTDQGGSCACTGLPLPACDDATGPACGGICPTAGEICLDNDNDGSCECEVLTLPQCDGAAAPVCGGLCPTGELCQSVGNDCECGAPGVPSCTTALSPACGGLCDVGQACVSNGTTCGCVQLPIPTCAESTVPACLGTCALGSTCGQVGDACQCSVLPIP